MVQQNKPAQFVLSSDSLSGYGLDLVFDLAKKAGFNGIDLATWKNFDAWNEWYVKTLVQKYELPITTIQVSNKVNPKELNQALDLCEETGARQININAPTYFDLKTFNFIVDNLPNYKKRNKDISFAIINPPEESYIIPVPKYRFTNIVEIIKKYHANLGLDITNVNEDALETQLLKKLDKFVPYISTIYFSDKTRLGKGHVLPGDGTLKLPSILKKLKKANYKGTISLKIDIEKKDLADSDKVLLILKKATKYYQENFLDIED